jgi:hypothetical protein
MIWYINEFYDGLHNILEHRHQFRSHVLLNLAV